MSRKLHLYRGGGKHRRGTHFGWRTLRQGIQHRLQLVYFLRLLRGGVPHGCDYAWTRVRVGDVRHQFAGVSQGTITGESRREDVRRGSILEIGKLKFEV